MVIFSKRAVLLAVIVGTGLFIVTNAKALKKVMGNETVPPGGDKQAKKPSNTTSPGAAEQALQTLKDLFGDPNFGA